MKIFLCLLTALVFSTQVQAHNLWLERDGDGPVRVYFGHYDTQILEKTGDRLDIIKAEKIIPGGTVLSRQRQADHIELNIATPSGIALIEAMNPRKTRTAEEIIRTVFLARNSPSLTGKELPLDLVTQQSNDHSFTLLLNGVPAPASEINVYDPDLQKQVYTTDKKGRVTLDVNKAGRYLVLATAIVEEGGSVNNIPYDKTRYSFTLTFVTKN
ncbi:hypothetical protein [uncultured Desulfuromusa sp.]|uniref:hypothetical protein n=1 Tax=uncultured Desulfuromusa sp. TaxID=219183 RepID=UPI002AA7D0D7|nr:hypothetical protein [uncultured Desulfuromusa sp.]